MSLDVGLMRRVDLELTTEIELSIQLRTRIRRRMTRRLAMAYLVRLEELCSVDRELSETIQFAIQQCALIRLYWKLLKLSFPRERQSCVDNQAAMRTNEHVNCCSIFLFPDFLKRD
jgi:hypothetical protein